MYGPCNFAAAEEHECVLTTLLVPSPPFISCAFKLPRDFLSLFRRFFFVFFAWWAREQ